MHRLPQSQLLLDLLPTQGSAPAHPLCPLPAVPPPICPPCPLPTHRDPRLPTVPAPSSAAQSPVPLGRALLAVALDLMLAGTTPDDPPRL